MTFCEQKHRFTNEQESIRSSIVYEIGLARSTAYTSKWLSLEESPRSHPKVIQRSC